MADQHDSQQVCLLQDALEPCAIVIFGATGDLAHRKLFPALYDLFTSNILPENCFIFGCGRTRLKNKDFRDSIEKSLRGKQNFRQDVWQKFSRSIYYQSTEYASADSFATLADSLRSLETKYATQGNTIFYLALPPSLYPTVATLIGRSLLSSRKASDSWYRLIIEKPFGHDLESARKLDHTLHRYFEEHQLFRIDHYLAKETVQNILLFRFANAIFEPVWNRQYIDSVHITAIESLGVEHRAGYFEQAGVIRDMFQNHMMQLLALTAMEPPASFETNQVRDEKTKVFSSLRPFNANCLDDQVILGQYGPGKISDINVVGYCQESGVDKNSVTPTYASIKMFIDNWRWQGVPFYVTSGKRLAEKRTEITIQFRAVPHSMLRHVLGEHITANRLIIGIAPKEKISLTFQAKTPGTALCLKSVTMDFHYKQQFARATVDGYGKVLIECIQGDQLLFWRQDSVEKSWQFLTPILDYYENANNQKKILTVYPAGSVPEKISTFTQEKS